MRGGGRLCRFLGWPMNFFPLQFFGGAVENLTPCERRYEWEGGGHQNRFSNKPTTIDLLIFKRTNCT